MNAPAYDPEERRDTPLALQLKARIRRDGPISVRDYMRACLHDREHGYYRTQAAIGRDGDFITAPEISQVFGELIGLWCAVVWQQMGSPAGFNLIELGPGRGTMLSDALRAARIVPGFLEAAEIALVETNPLLVDKQRLALGAHASRASWHAHATLVPPAPSIIVANELLDALPVTQFVRCAAGWQERRVAIDGKGALAFGVRADRPVLHLPLIHERAAQGDIIERRSTMYPTFALDRFAKAGPIAALFIDYGPATPQIGDTLQAVRAQRYEHPLTSPGEADLSALVDFAAFGQDVRSRKLATDGPVTQAEFLGSLGIMERASRLMAANPARASAIEAGVMRLMAPNGMGTRFKAIGVRSAGLPPLPGFPAP